MIKFKRISLESENMDLMDKILPRDRAIITNSDGEQIKIVKLGKYKSEWKETIDKKDHRFVLNRKLDKYITIKGFWKNYRYYVFNKDHINPISLSYNEAPKFHSADLDILLETKVLKDLNTVQTDGWLSNIKLKHVLIGLAILAVIIYFMRGGTFT